MQNGYKATQYPHTGPSWPWCENVLIAVDGIVDDKTNKTDKAEQSEPES